MNICVYGASSNSINSSYIKAGEQFGEALAKSGHGIIFGGGANGMMGAVARGMTKGNGKIVGIAPSFFKVDGALYDKCTEFVYTETMRERKKIMEEMSDGFAVTPGGVGTFDEFFEIFTLRQLSRHTKPIAIFNVDGYFNPMVEMLQSAIEKKFMSEKNNELFFVSSDISEIISYFENYKVTDVKLSELKDVR